VAFIEAFASHWLHCLLSTLNQKTWLSG